MKLLKVVLMIAISNIAYSQKITFTELQSLRTKDLAEVETYLTTSDWKMTEAEESTESTMGSATFGYKVNDFDNKKATSWIVYYQSTIGVEFNRISYQISNSTLYSNLLESIKKSNFKLESSKIGKGEIIKIYMNETETCIITVSTSEGTYTKVTSYSFIFMNKIDYETSKIKKE